MVDDNKPIDYLDALAAPKRSSVQLHVFNGGRDASPIRGLITGAQEATDDLGGGGDRGGGAAGGAGAGTGPVFGSHDMLAAKLSERLGEDWRYAADIHLWYRWTGARFEGDRKNQIKDVSRQVCSELAAEVDNQRFARQIASEHSIDAAIRLAATHPRHVILSEQFDPSPWHINTPGGIVDLTTGELLPHDRSALMTCMTAAGPGGECPRFRAFLEEATGGDPKLQSFLQRIAGYCLTGSVEEHAIFFLYGLSGTGKTVFLNVLADLLADYAAVAAMDLFTVAVGERHSAPLAALHAARLVVASETDEGKRWDEAKLKSITGGDPVTANRMRSDPFTFRPKFKLLMAGNHRPHMRSADDAMRRRLHIIPFMAKPKEVDKELLEKLRPEFGGILKWAIAGGLDRRRLGLAPPRGVVDATDDYFEAENMLGRWLDERCTWGADVVDVVDGKKRPAFTTSKALYRDFRGWRKRPASSC